MDPKTTRGYLNNNPTNMDRSDPAWNGEIRDVNDPRLTGFQRGELTSGRFCVFVDAPHGYRAACKNLWAYHDRLGISTIRGLINKWAPPNENNTEAYIQNVARTIGISADAPCNVHDFATMAALLDAITRVECAGMPYTPDVIEAGLALAGLQK